MNEITAIIRKLEQRRALGKRSSFTLRGRSVSLDGVKSYVRRKGGKDSFPRESGAQTPPYLRCFTPEIHDWDPAEPGLDNGHGHSSNNKSFWQQGEDFKATGYAEPSLHPFMASGFDFETSMTCPACYGRGETKRAVKTCISCNGTGIKDIEGQISGVTHQFQTLCLDCEGMGKKTVYHTGRCERCSRRNTVIGRKVPAVLGVMPQQSRAVVRSAYISPRSG